MKALPQSDPWGIALKTHHSLADAKAAQKRIEVAQQHQCKQRLAQFHQYRDAMLCWAILTITGATAIVAIWMTLR